MTDPRPDLEIIVPVYNEEAALPIFHQKLASVLDGMDCRVRICYINDGSNDKTREIIAGLAQADSRITSINLTRNFGHQAALTAGLDQSTAHAVITLDGDGQHPPEMIPEMYQLFQSGYDIVATQRLDEKNAAAKDVLSRGFYWFINRVGSTEILPGTADFRLLSRKAADALCGMREYHRFLRGMTAWTGFRSVILPYNPPERLAGKSKYSLRKQLRLAGDALFSFSLVPLQFGLIIGLLFFLLAAAEAVYVLSFWLTGAQSSLEPGWSSLMFMLLIVGGTLMVLLSFIGIYIGYIFQEVKRRPIYLVQDKISPSDDDSAQAGGEAATKSQGLT